MAAKIDLPLQSSALRLPLDVFPAIFRHLPQKDLCVCLRVCKEFLRMITKDAVLLAKLQAVNSYAQFRSYLDVGKIYYEVEYYTEIGQDDTAKFPYFRKYVVKKVSRRHEEEMHLDYESPPEDKHRNVSGSMLFSERIMEQQHQIFRVNEFDALLKLLEELWLFVNNPDNKLSKG